MDNRITDNSGEAAEITLLVALLALIRTERRWFWGAFACVILLGLLFLQIMPAKYSASLYVAPADIGSNGGSGAPSAAGALSSTLGLSLGQANTVTPYDQFLNTLDSTDLAAYMSKRPGLMQRIFSSDWDGQRWRPPFLSPSFWLSSAANLMVGRKAWVEPSPTKLAQYISDSVAVSKVGITNIYRIEYKSSDPVFAKEFLQAIFDRGNEIIRQQYLRRMNAYIDFLESRLREATIAEVRVSLSQAIVDDERLRASASSGLPFAARSLSDIAVSDRPVEPDPKVIVPVSILFGLLAGLAAAYARARSRVAKSGPFHWLGMRLARR